MFSGQYIFGQDSATTSSTRTEAWPEINIYYKINQKLRIYGTYSATKLENSEYADGGIGIYADYFAFPGLRKKFKIPMRDSTRGYYLWVRGGYMYSTTPKDVEPRVYESVFVTEFNLKFHLPYDILLTNKQRLDWRFVNGDFQPRYRTKLNFEKDMHTAFLTFTPYYYLEYFVPLYSGGANRLRMCLGSELRVTKNMNFEVYGLHQFENGSKIPAVNAVGIVFKFYFVHQEVKQNMAKRKQKGLELKNKILN